MRKLIYKYDALMALIFPLLISIFVDATFVMLVRFNELYEHKDSIEVFCKALSIILCLCSFALFWYADHQRKMYSLVPDIIGRTVKLAEDMLGDSNIFARIQSVPSIGAGSTFDDVYDEKHNFVITNVYPSVNSFVKKKSRVLLDVDTRDNWLKTMGYSVTQEQPHYISYHQNQEDFDISEHIRQQLSDEQIKIHGDHLSLRFSRALFTFRSVMNEKQQTIGFENVEASAYLYDTSSKKTINFNDNPFKQGSLMIDNIPEGEYVLVVSKQGYETLASKPFHVVNIRHNLDVALNVALVPLNVTQSTHFLIQAMYSNGIPLKNEDVSFVRSYKNSGQMVFSPAKTDENGFITADYLGDKSVVGVAYFYLFEYSRIGISANGQKRWISNPSERVIKLFLGEKPDKPDIIQINEVKVMNIAPNNKIALLITVGYSLFSNTQAQVVLFGLSDNIEMWSYQDAYKFDIDMSKSSETTRSFYKYIDATGVEEVKLSACLYPPNNTGEDSPMATSNVYYLNLKRTVNVYG